MIGPAELSKTYLAWNKKWGAPYGHSKFRRLPFKSNSLVTRLLGPFAWQGNSATRHIEYPWVYEQISKHGTKLTVVEVGGSLSGLQFVLAKEGHKVTNVDPAMAATGKGWPLDRKKHDQICKVVDVTVDIIASPIQDAKIPDNSVDVVYSVSALEHFSESDIDSFARETKRILKPKGIAVLTVDLFIDVTPFTRKPTNQWGKNINIAEFLEKAGLQLHTGNPNELCGMKEFDPVKILELLPQYFLSVSGPCVPQCLVGVKP